MDVQKNLHILKINSSNTEEIEDVVAVEKKLRISVNGRHLVSLFCTPTMVRELVTGFIHNESLISGDWCSDRMSIEYGDEISVDIPASGTVSEGEKTITSGCAGGISFSKRPGIQISKGEVVFQSENIFNVFREFQKKSDAFRQTGGVHSAALSDGSSILGFAEDIGRHNAVDKVVGYALMENMPLNQAIILVSGRLSSEIVSKCLRAGVPVLASRSAPTTLAVELAISGNLTLIGFVRGTRMNVYSCKERVLL